MKAYVVVKGSGTMSATGDTQVTKVTGPPEDYQPNPYLLVDAGRTLAVRANAASIEEARSAIV